MTKHRPFYEIKSSDVGKPLLRAFGRTWQTSSFIGRILKQDVGKYIILVDRDLVQVENDEQRATRLSKAGFLSKSKG